MYQFENFLPKPQYTSVPSLCFAGVEVRGMRAELPQAVRLQDPQRLQLQEAQALQLRRTNLHRRRQQPVTPLQVNASTEASSTKSESFNSCHCTG